ncbi:MAG: Fur family transcriptional regulator [Coprococcus sp.]
MKEKRNTWQKQVIYSVLEELHNHPTAQELYEELLNRGYDLGKSTVYRVLADAVEEGRIDSVYSADRKEHFDGNINRHYHIRCKKCGKIYDSHMTYDPQLTVLGGTADEGFTMLTHNVEFVCICPECQ